MTRFRKKKKKFYSAWGNKIDRSPKNGNYNQKDIIHIQESILLFMQKSSL